MSGIYIPGMEMPKCCFDCQFMYGRRYCRANSRIEFNDPDYSELKGRYDGCPLVHVPEHGRLIDADAMQEEWYRLNFDRKISDGTLAYWNYRLSQMPTIIPADPAEEGEG